MQITYKCRGPRLVRTRPQRKGCGFNLTRHVEALPKDGGQHVITCPECKNEVTVTTPNE